MPTESHESVTDIAGQSAVDTWEATSLDAPYSASWQWRLNTVFIRGINLSSSRSSWRRRREEEEGRKKDSKKKKEKKNKHWNKCVLFPNSNFNFLAQNPEQVWKEHAPQLLYMSQQQNYPTVKNNMQE